MKSIRSSMGRRQFLVSSARATVVALASGKAAERLLLKNETALAAGSAPDSGNKSPLTLAQRVQRLKDSDQIQIHQGRRAVEILAFPHLLHLPLSFGKREKLDRQRFRQGSRHGHFRGAAAR